VRLHAPAPGLVVAILALIAVVSTGSAAPAAVAATTVGQLSVPNDTCNAPVTLFQLEVAGGNSYAVPSPGVMTAWSFEDSATTVAGLKLMVGRTPDGANYTIVGESAAGPQSANAVNTYATRIPVQVNDEIGLFADSGVCFTSTNVGGDLVGFVPGEVPIDTTAAFTLGTTAGKLPVTGIVEPDGDRDGFGDETQDACPTDAGTHGPCPSPPPPPPSPPPPPPPPADTTPPALSARTTSAALSKSGSLSFFVTSTENAAGRATGTIGTPGRSKLRFVQRGVALAAGRQTKVTLRLSATNAALVRRARSKTKSLKANVTLVVRDAAGNAAAKNLAFTLKR
jgi:hypothetical protein